MSLWPDAVLVLGWSPGDLVVAAVTGALVACGLGVLADGVRGSRR